MIGGVLVGDRFGSVYDAVEIIRLVCPLTLTQSLESDFGIDLVCPTTILIESTRTVYER